MLQYIRLGVIGDEVIVLVVPGEGKGTDNIVLPVPAQDLFLFHVIFVVFKGYLPVLRDSRVQLIHVIVYALVHGLHSVPDKELAAQRPPLGLAALSTQLFDELHGFFISYKLRGLHRVHKELQLRQFKAPPCECIAAEPSPPAGDIKSELPESLNIPIYALALGVDAVLLQLTQKLRHGNARLPVSLFPQYLQHIEYLQLLVLAPRHSLPPPDRTYPYNRPRPAPPHGASLFWTVSGT